MSGPLSSVEWSAVPWDEKTNTTTCPLKPKAVIVQTCYHSCFEDWEVKEQSRNVPKSSCQSEKNCTLRSTIIGMRAIS
ncbi:hypothetical protein NDU88_004306 [Pleurodeles waltl]|uniref:Uncharacterized protein n=1 Tax=Pleurodeles waltl TaxID=8319 RepID=A0AAV7WXC8_PLEWA|nr:hypothetical protein NDU88_004306 [Pleurodeles waltl]